MVVARHEAGHAVISAILRKPFDYVTIVPAIHKGEIAHGHMSYNRKNQKAAFFRRMRKLIDENPKDPALFKRLERILDKRARLFCKKATLVTIAGPIAQQRPLEGQCYSSEGCNSDYENAHKMITEITNARNENKLMWLSLCEQCVKLVYDHWNSIEAVSHELLVKRRLSSREVRKIVKAPPPPTPPLPLPRIPAQTAHFAKA